MTARSKIQRTTSADYQCTIELNTACATVYRALTTVRGLRGWWTTSVSGRATASGTVRFDFPGADEHILMRVEKSARPSVVHWLCLEHTALPEWTHTEPRFELISAAVDRCTLRFRHVGLSPKLVCFDDCKKGWDYFLASLTGYAESGQGTPWSRHL